MSQCKYCLNPIIWIAKPNGGWHPPFDAAPELRSLDYEVHWNNKTEDWVAQPVDQELSVKMSFHDCTVRADLMRRQVEEEYEEEPPPPVSQPVVQYKTVERVVFRNPKPEQYVKVAERLKMKCPTCGALPFIWCHYKDYPEELTVNLHTSRSV